MLAGLVRVSLLLAVIAKVIVDHRKDFGFVRGRVDEPRQDLDRLVPLAAGPVVAG